MFSSEEALWLKIALKKEFITKDQIAQFLQNPQKQKETLRKLLCESGYLNETQAQQVDQIWNILQQKQPSVTTNIAPSTIEIQKDSDETDQDYEEVSPDEEPPPPDEEPPPLPAEPTSIEPRSGEELFQKALQYLEKKQMIQAMNVFDQVLQENPQFVEAYYHKGKIHLQLTEVPEALDLFSKAIALRPNYMEALESRGSIYLERGDRAKAEADFLKVIELCPEKQEALSQRFYYPNVSDKSELQKLMLQLKLEKKQDDLQKNMQTQRIQLLTSRFETKKIILAAQQLEAEKNKTRKIRAVDQTRSRALNIGGDTQFVDSTTSDPSKLSKNDSDFQKPQKEQNKTSTTKPKKVALTEESFASVSNIFSSKNVRASKEISWIQEILCFLVVIVLGGYFYNRDSTSSLTTQPFLYPISSADY
ncbi:MAG: tetratricopeptide repeat protein, partial [Planctomycetota bacterium]